MYDLPITSVILSVLMRAFPMIPALVHEMSPLLERGYVWERWVYRPNSRRSSVKKKTNKKTTMIGDEIYLELSDENIPDRYGWLQLLFHLKLILLQSFFSCSASKYLDFLGPFPLSNYKWHQWPSKALVSNIIDFYNM